MKCVSSTLATPRLRTVAALVAAGLLVLAGCSTTSGRSPGQRLDPFEPWNRDVFAFNERLDETVLKPVATGYSNVVPQPIRRSVGNIFGNVADAWSAINNLLQGKFSDAAHDMVRVGTNTIFGIGGAFDVASEFGLDHKYEDFGQTLGYWGIGAGAYIVWPLLGPSTVRESIALPFDRAATPAVLIDNGAAQLSITALQVVNTRANLLGASRVIDDIALDKYTFVRDAYLQRRRSLVFDGDAPATDEPAPSVMSSAAPASAPAAAASAAK